MSTILKRKLEIKNTLASSKSKNWKPSPPCMQVRHLSASSRNRSHPCSSLSVHYPRVKGVNTISSLSSKSKTPTSWICKLLGNMDFKLKSSKLPTTVLQPSLLVLIYLSMSFLGLICQAMSHLQGALTKQPKKKKKQTTYGCEHSLDFILRSFLWEWQISHRERKTQVKKKACTKAYPLQHRKNKWKLNRSCHLHHVIKAGCLLFRTRFPNLTNNSLGVVFKTKHLQPSPKTFTTGIQ